MAQLFATGIYTTIWTLPGELADLSGVIFLFPVLGEIFLLPIVLASVVEGFGALFQKIFFPISQKIGKKAVF